LSTVFLKKSRLFFLHQDVVLLPQNWHNIYLCVLRKKALRICTPYITIKKSGMWARLAGIIFAGKIFCRPSKIPKPQTKRR